jgi:hypothetical protein
MKPGITLCAIPLSSSIHSLSWVFDSSKFARWVAELVIASEQAIRSIAGHISVEIIRHDSHIRQEAKRIALASLDHGTITVKSDK